MRWLLLLAPLVSYAGDEIEGIGGTGQQPHWPQDADLTDTPDLPELPEVPSLPEAMDMPNVPEVDAGLSGGDEVEAPDVAEPPEDDRG
ncbi:hypothetical protein CHH28_16255 [Bacterioplanes sanyensis]|uniref:Uncharacterized protein n=2 Tax=Bacterioplanes sanyensis TaxID=1249553 RepID=A0A222FP22_9GAMM|nr:hypothetical protein CHH28_16255 [Bacterioplanes sanyensis]